MAPGQGPESEGPLEPRSDSLEQLVGTKSGTDGQGPTGSCGGKVGGGDR